MATITLPSKIIITADPELRAKLERKMEEYKHRWSFPYRAPEVTPYSTYRCEALSELLEKGSCDVDALRARYSGTDWFHAPEFEDSVDVIMKYNAGLAHEVRGGTGLK
ncbi:hypothetical protein HY633_02005 [Candidatus Uhrbacteria bacterium]|nr:hypothetical protein [Candidatus Uhrbacteria bacterium]